MQHFENQYLLTEDGVYAITTELTIPPEQAFAKWGRRTKICDKIFQFNEYTKGLGSKYPFKTQTHLIYHQDKFLTLTPLPYVPLFLSFTIEGKSKDNQIIYRTAWNGRGSGNQIIKTSKMLPNPNERAIFVLVGTLQSAPNNSLFIIRRDDEALLSPPLGNIAGNGSVCLGGLSISSLVEHVPVSLRALFENEWNVDLQQPSDDLYYFHDDNYMFTGEHYLNQCHRAGEGAVQLNKTIQDVLFRTIENFTSSFRFMRS